MKINLKVLIVDDEEGAIDTLRGMLNEFCPEVTIVGTAISVAKAIALTEELMPDLVFLDIELSPLGGGFDYLKILKNINFQVIFTTAYPQYAVKAINVIQPLAYLIKPYSVSELVDAVHRATDKKQLSLVKPELSTTEHGIIISGGKKGNIVLRYTEITFCRADKMLSDIFVQREGKTIKIISYSSIGDLEKQLTPSCFMRVHNSYIVNFLFVSSFEISGKIRTIQMQNGDIIPISIAMTQDFKSRFNDFWSGT
jgi:two-component system, LytTR family, response regulator